MPAAAAKKPATFPENSRQNEWSDLRCFEKEIEASDNDDERISIIERWMIKYKFTQAWKTWCVQTMSNADKREQLRSIFDSDNIND